MEQDSDTQSSGGGEFTPTSLGDILRDGASRTEREPAGRQEPLPTEAAPVETGESPAAPPTDARPRDESGRFASKEAPPETGPPPAEQTAPQTVPMAAMLEERKKRQAYEARIRELEARISAPAPVQQHQQPAPDIPMEDLMFQDPQRFVEAIRAPFEAQLAQTRLAMSERVARQQPDYDAAVEALVHYAEANPQARGIISQTLNSHPDPAGWGYEQGRAILAQQRWGAVTQQYGSPEAYLAAQAQQQTAQQPVAQPAVPSPPTPPGSLASVRSAGPRGAPVWNGPTPLSAILGRR